MKFKDFCVFKEGYVNPSQKFPTYFDGPIKWLRATDLNNSSVYETSRTLSETGFKSAGKSAILFKPETIAISKSGTIGKLGILKDYMCGNRAIINIDVDSKKADLYYVFFWLMHNQFNIQELAVGSVQKNLYIPILAELEIPNISLFEQRKISKILLSLSEKIELNNEIYKTLEEMAQTLFKRWFFEYNFPDENNDPFKLSGGKFIDSEMGMIPEGWEVKNLHEFVDSISKSINKKEKKKAIFLNTSDILEGQFLHQEYTDVSEMPGQAKKLIQKNDILYSEIRPANKRFAYVDFDAEDYVVSTKLMVLRTDEKVFSSKCIYLFLKSSQTLQELQQLAESRSGTFPQITFNELSKFKFALPKKELFTQNYEILENMIEHQFELIKENRSLTLVRDALLPKLISGEITIMDAEKEAEECLQKSN
jgi:type I restriction enzyme, S subunit